MERNKARRATGSQEGPHRGAQLGERIGDQAEEVSGHPAGVCELGPGKVGGKKGQKPA